MDIKRLPKMAVFFHCKINGKHIGIYCSTPVLDL